MDLRTMIFELWDEAGRPSDIDPTNDLGTTAIQPSEVVATRPETIRLARILDWSQQAVAAFKDERVRGLDSFWWTAGLKTIPITVGPLSFLAGDAGANLNQAIGTFTEDYSGAVLSWLNGTTRNYRAIVGADLTNLLVYPEMPIASTGLTCTVYPKWGWLPQTSRITAVHRVFVLKPSGNIAELNRAMRTEEQDNFINSVGSPSTFWVRGRKILFDKAIDDVYYMRVRCQCGPSALDTTTLMDVGGVNIPGVDLDSICELPDQFHRAVILKALGWAHGLLQDGEMSMKYQGDFTMTMRQTLDERIYLMAQDEGLDVNWA